MSAWLGRISGALLLQRPTPLPEGAAGFEYYLIGDTKRPCNWEALGFVAPPQRDPLREPWLKLVPLSFQGLSGKLPFQGPVLRLPHADQAAVELLARRLLVPRNGSVSERLWRLVLGAEDDEDVLESPSELDAGWLLEMPERLWAIVQRAVLTCS
ncbi:MAG TPA: hypothetical protein VFQ61_28990 [Polyangiaceae bacterium]|nr:hypothetical protein [Polyangiaceae bacterium]